MLLQQTVNNDGETFLKIVTEALAKRNSRNTTHTIQLHCESFSIGMRLNDRLKTAWNKLDTHVRPTADNETFLIHSHLNLTFLLQSCEEKSQSSAPAPDKNTHTS